MLSSSTIQLGSKYFWYNLGLNLAHLMLCQKLCQMMAVDFDWTMTSTYLPIGQKEFSILKDNFEFVIFQSQSRGPFD